MRVFARRGAFLCVALIGMLLLAACDDGDNGDATPSPTAGATADPETTPDPDNGPTGGDGAVQWDACPFETPADVEMECGTLEVPAQRDDPDAGAVTLAFGVVSAEGDDVADDPIVYLSGGPGQSALDMVGLAYGEVYEPLVQNRDLIILDQRGTGYSQPSLACDEYTEWAIESIGSEATAEEVAERGAEVLDDCRERLVDEGIDLSAFNSAASAADLDDLRQALGYDEWNVYGISYGTRLALTAARDFGDGIRSLVLDASYPLEADLYADTPGNANRAINALFDACTADGACADRFPDLEAQFEATVADLNEEPQQLMLIDPMTGERIETEIDGNGLVGFLFQSLYATDLIQFLPEIIDEAAAGNFGTIGLLQGSFILQLDFMSVGQQLAVQCHEEIAFSDPETVAAAATEHPLLAGFFEAHATLGPRVFDICDRWEAGEPGEAENDPVTSDLPALVLSGELDPITPPAWGEAVASNLPNSHHFQFPLTGHGVIGAHECGAEMTHAFLDDPTTAPSDACIDDITAPAFTAGEVEVELEPVTNEAVGSAGVAPVDWLEVLPGIYQESALVALIQQAVPGITEELLLQQVALQLGSDEIPEPVEEYETPYTTWSIYEIEDLGQRIDLALADHDGTLLVIQLTAPPARADAYYEAVFRPVVDAFDPDP